MWPYPWEKCYLIPEKNVTLSLRKMLLYPWEKCDLIPEKNVTLSLRKMWRYPWEKCYLISEKSLRSFSIIPLNSVPVLNTLMLVIAAGCQFVVFTIQQLPSLDKNICLLISLSIKVNSEQFCAFTRNAVQRNSDYNIFFFSFLLFSWHYTVKTNKKRNPHTFSIN